MSSNKGFENETIGITGGTSRIGKANSLAFAKEEPNVVFSGRRNPKKKVAGD